MNHPLLFRGLAACFFLAVFSASAATRTWNGSASAYWTNLANWQGGVLPGSGDDVVFPDSATRKTVTNTMDTPALHSVTFSGSNYVLQGAGGVYLVITNRLQSQAPGTNSVRHRMFLINNTTIENSLAGSVFDLKSHLPAGSSTNMINIASDNTFTGAGDIVLTHMRLAASQSQSLIKSGSGTLFFSGTASDWTGGFYVNGGRLELQSGLLDPGNVIVSSNGVFAGNGSVFTAYLHATGVIEPGRGSGLNVNNEFIFDQDSIMRIPFGMNSSPTAGKVDLNGQTSASDMRVGLELFATESLVTFSNQTFKIINDVSSTLDAMPRLFAGVPEGGYVAGVGQVFQLSYKGGDGSNDVAITHLSNPPANGTNRTWAGVSGGNGNWLTSTNWIGTNAPKHGDDLVFPASADGRSLTNNYIGAPFFGELRFAAPNYVIRGQPFALAGGLVVSNGAAARFRAPVSLAVDQTFRSDDTLIFYDTLNLWKRTLNLLGSGTTEIQNGLTSDFGAVIEKNGPGTLIFSGANTFIGRVTLSRGLTINTAVFPTADTDSRLTLTTNATLRLEGGGIPGLIGDGGTLELAGALAGCNGRLKLTNTVVRWDLAMNPGLYISQDVNLSGAILELTNSAGALPAQAIFTNIFVTPGYGVTGTYAGLPENSVVSYGTNQFRIHYAGGTGNDLVLEIIPPVTTYTWDGGGVGAAWLNRTNWNSDLAISANATLVFPSGAAQTVNTNGTNVVFTFYNKIELRGTGYSLRGVPLTLAEGILNKPTPTTGTNFILFDQSLLSSNYFQSDSGLLRINGNVDLASYNLEVKGSGDTWLAGQLSGSGRLTKTGTGFFQLGSPGITNGFTGDLIADSGVLHVTGNFYSGTTKVKPGAILSGAGTVKDVTVQSGGRVEPGIGGKGSLIARGMTFNAGGTLALNLYPTNSADNNRVYAAFGDVVLSNATLELHLAHAPQPGEHHVLLDTLNVGHIVGTFAGLPESALIPVSNVLYTITYINSIAELDYYAFTSSATTRTWQGTGAIAPLWGNNGNWVGNTPPGSGENVLFPATATARTTTNAIVRLYNQLRFAAPNYEVWAPQLGLWSGVVVSNAAGARFHTPMIAASNLVFDVDGLLRLYDSLKLVDHNLVVKGTGETRLDGAVSSTGNLIKNGTGSLRFAEANVANFTANSGTVELANLTASSPLPLVCSSNVSFDPSVTLIARFGDDNAAVRAPLQAGGNFNPASATLSLIVSYTAATNDVLVLATAGTAITTTFAGLPEGATLSSGGVNWQISYAANGGKRLTLTAQNSAPVPPTFTSVSKLGNGNIRLQGTGATNIPIVIEATTNFTDWSDVANRNVTGGSFQFDDTNAPALNSRHYRARIQ